MHVAVAVRAQTPYTVTQPAARDEFPVEFAWVFVAIMEECLPGVLAADTVRRGVTTRTQPPILYLSRLPSPLHVGQPHPIF